MDKSVDILQRSAEDDSMMRSKKVEEIIAEDSEKKIVLEFQKELSEMEVAFAKGKESIKEHEKKTEEMLDYLNDWNQALTEELYNARKQLTLELDAKERKIVDAEENRRLEKETHETQMKLLREKLIGMKVQEIKLEVLKQIWFEMYTDKVTEVVRLERELRSRKEETKAKDRKIMELEQQMQAEKDKAEAAIANERKRIHEEIEQQSIFHSEIVEAFHAKAKRLHGEMTKALEEMKVQTNVNLSKNRKAALKEGMVSKKRMKIAHLD